MIYSMEKTSLTIFLSSAYILGVIAFLRDNTILFAAFILLLLIFVVVKNYLSGKRAVIIYFFFLLAILNSSFQIKNHDDLSVLAPSYGSITGTVISIPTTNNEDRSKFYFDAESGIFQGEEYKHLKARTIVTIYDSQKNLSSVKIGDRMELTGFLNIPNDAKNPSQFDYRNYLKNHKTFSVFYVKSSNWKEISGPQKPGLKFLQHLNNKRHDIIEIHKQYVKSPNVEVLGGIVFGDDAINPPNEIKTSFINSGLLHILAASGMNVSIIFGMWFFIANLFRFNYRFTILFGAVLVAMYTLMTGMGPSVLRAALMIEFVLFGKLIDRDADSIALIFFVAMVLLLYNPAMITDVGFQLSFVVTFALMFYCPPILSKIDNKILDFLAGSVLIPVVAQLWASPIQMFYFNTFSTYSVFANFLISPLIVIISFLGFLGSTLALIPLIADKVCMVFDFVLNPVVTLLVKISNYFSDLPYSLLFLPNPTILQCLLYYSILLIFGFLVHKGFKSKRLYVLLSIFLLMLMLSFIKIPSDKCEILSFSVGNADSFLIKTTQNKYVMIDTARGSNKEGGFSLADSIMNKYMQNKNIKKLDYIILTHFDADHIGGTVDVIKKVNVGKVIINSHQKNTPTAKRLMSYLKENNINYEILKGHKTLIKEKDFVITTYAPNFKGKKTDNKNSILALVSYKKFDMLFMGDGDFESIKNAQFTLPQNVEILKVGHHGAADIVNEEMLKRNKYDAAVISTGKNQYGHPNRETLDKLSLNGIQIYRTDVNNAVNIVSNGDNYKIQNFNSERHKFVSVSEANAQ